MRLDSTLLPPYNSLIDEEIEQFIHETSACYPADAVDLSISEQRQLYDQMCAFFYHGRPANVSIQDLRIEPAGMKIREYRTSPGLDAASVTVLYYHGGGFVVGGLESHDDVCAEICSATGFRVIACDYRLAPEHTHPAAFEDSLALFDWAAHTHSDTIVVAGDSAGANLAAALSAHTVSSPRAPAGQVLIYPYLGGPMDEGSAVTHADAPMLSTEDLHFYHQIRTGGSQPASTDSSYAPLWGQDFSALPNSVVFSAECDPLCDEGLYYTQAVTDAGGKARWFREEGLVHGYLRARHRSARASNSFERILQAITATGKKQWPY